MRMAAASVCAMGIVLLTGCDQLSRVWGDEPGSAQPRATVANSRPATVAKRPSTRNVERPAPQQQPEEAPLQLVGLGEDDVRAMFGPPTVAEESGPGKTWRYQNGRCTLNLSFYPDVETRVYRTLAYEVTSDDNNAERKRVCLSQFQSVARSR